MISDLDEQEITIRQKWLANECMLLIAAKAGCSVQEPPNDHDHAG